MWLKENVLFYAATIKEITDRIKTFKEVFNDTINVERDLAASSVLQRNKNSDYFKMYDSMNDRNNKTTRFNVARDNNLN